MPTAQWASACVCVWMIDPIFIRYVCSDDGLAGCTDGAVSAVQRLFYCILTRLWATSLPPSLAGCCVGVYR